MLSRPSKEFNSNEDNQGNVILPGLSEDFNTFAFNPYSAEFTFEDIIAFAGNYFQLNEETIFLGETDEERRSRFLNAYETISMKEPTQDEEAQIITITNDSIQNQTDDKHNNTPEESSNDEYSSGESDSNNNDPIIILSDDNLSRFHQYALGAFQTGYTLAMETAVAASTLSTVEEQQEKLKCAYVLSGFACHFMIAVNLTYISQDELKVEADIKDEANLEITQHSEGDDLVNPVQLVIQEIYQGFKNKEATPVSQSMAMKLLLNAIAKKEKNKIETEALTSLTKKNESGTQELQTNPENEKNNDTEGLNYSGEYSNLVSQSMFKNQDLRLRKNGANKIELDAQETSDESQELEVGSKYRGICPTSCNIF